MAAITKTAYSTYRVRYRDMSGRQRGRTFKRHADAVRWARTVEVNKDRGEYTDPNDAKIKVAVWLEQWESTRLNRRASTRVRDESLIRNHLIPAFGTKSLGSVTPADVKTFVADLHRRGYAATTVAKAYQLVAGAFGAAVDEGRLPRTPCRGVKLPKNERREMRYLTADEIAKLAATIHPRFKTLVIAAGYTGMRAGELSALTVDNLDLLRRRVQVVQTATETRGYWSVGPTKTKASRRALSIPKALCELLASHLTEYGTGENGLVFTGAEGGPIRWSNFRRRY